MKKQIIFLVAMTFAILNTAWGQCEKKSAQPAKMFLNNGGAGPYVKTGDAIYAGIMVNDNDGVPKVALINQNCNKQFEIGDRIRSINQTVINTAKDWEKSLKSFKKGDTVTITIERGGQTRNVEVVLDTIAVYQAVI